MTDTQIGVAHALAVAIAAEVSARQLVRELTEPGDSVDEYYGQASDLVDLARTLRLTLEERAEECALLGGCESCGSVVFRGMSKCVHCRDLDRKSESVSP